MIRNALMAGGALLVGLVVLGALAGDPTPEADDTTADTAPATTQADDDPPADTTAQDDAGEDEGPEFVRRDRRACRTFADLIVSETGEPNADSMLDLAQQLRRLSNSARHDMLTYHLEGMANDVDGIIEGGATSERVDAYQANMGEVARYCAQALPS